MNERFSRHELIPGWRQSRLEGATVVVVGVGALGNEVARLLAMAGVGRLVLCDPDRIARSNLSRTVLFRDADVGSFKVEAAARALRELAPGVTVEARPEALVCGVGLAELREADLVLGCLDSRAARLQLAGRCNLVGAPSIDGGTQPWGGELRPHLEAGGPCYGCSLSPEDRAVADVPWSCLDTSEQESTGAAAPSSALIGAWQAQTALRFLMDLAAPSDIQVIDGAAGTVRHVRQRRDAECLLHGSIPAEIETLRLSHLSTAGELREALGPRGTALAWEPFQVRVQCPSCTFDEERSGRPEPAPCPRCGADLRPRTTLELASAPDSALLRSLGVAPREILAVRGADGLDWVELHCSPSAVSESSYSLFVREEAR